MKRKPMKEPLQIAGILSGILQKKGLGSKLAQYQVFEIWDSVVGPTISKQAQPLKMQGQTLLVSAKNSGWAQELTFMKPFILKKINEALPNSGIKDIRFTAGKR